MLTTIIPVLCHFLFREPEKKEKKRTHHNPAFPPTPPPPPFPHTHQKPTFHLEEDKGPAVDEDQSVCRCNDPGRSSSPSLAAPAATAAAADMVWGRSSIARINSWWLEDDLGNAMPR